MVHNLACLPKRVFRGQERESPPIHAVSLRRAKHVCDGQPMCTLDLASLKEVKNCAKITPPLPECNSLEVSYFNWLPFLVALSQLILLPTRPRGGFLHKPGDVY
jgi:hypothetical protein